MELEDAFKLGYMLGAAFHFEHRKDKFGIDFHEAIDRFRKGNLKSIQNVDVVRSEIEIK